MSITNGSNEKSSSDFERNHLCFQVLTVCELILCDLMKSIQAPTSTKLGKDEEVMVTRQ
jgi:hypothetical protein